MIIKNELKMSCPIYTQTRVDERETKTSHIQIIESLECIKGNGPADLEKIVVVQAAILLCQAGIASNQVQGEEMVLKTFKNGSALEKFLQILGNQGMNLIFSGVLYILNLKSSR